MRKFIRKPLYTEQLKQWIIEAIDAEGFSVDLNHIDVSDIDDFEGLFQHSRFNGDISKWNVSKVTNMKNMFYGSGFNGDISQWNTSNVINMQSMFAGSEFNGDISNWNTSKVINMCNMFEGSMFRGDISQWNTSNVQMMESIFKGSDFDGDLERWNFESLMSARHAFSKFHPNLLGYLGVLHGEYEFPQSHPMRERLEQLQAVYQTLGMLPIAGARFIQHALQKQASIGFDTPMNIAELLFEEQ